MNEGGKRTFIDLCRDTCGDVMESEAEMIRKNRNVLILVLALIATSIAANKLGLFREPTTKAPAEISETTQKNKSLDR